MDCMDDEQPTEAGTYPSSPAARWAAARTRIALAVTYGIRVCAAVLDDGYETFGSHPINWRGRTFEHPPTARSKTTHFSSEPNPCARLPAASVSASPWCTAK
uniref:hypothetical protein n=1 Tax=Nocardia suismassiliense TaxID=2077092 RepID=UPI003F490AC1